MLEIVQNVHKTWNEIFLFLTKAPRKHEMRFFIFDPPPPHTPPLGCGVIENQNNGAVEIWIYRKSHSPYLLSGEATFHVTPC